jgi:hypothetical protein
MREIAITVAKGTAMRMLLFFFVLFSHAQTSNGDKPQIIEVGEMQAEVSPSYASAKELEASRPKKDLRIFPILMAEEMSLEDRIADAYLKNLDVFAWDSMLRFLCDTFPSRRMQFERIFEARLEARTADRALVLVTDSESRKDVAALIKQIDEAELKRTLELSNKVAAELNLAERNQLSKFLVKEQRMRALEFPLVSHNFGLSDDQVVSVREGNRKMAKAIAIAIRDYTYSAESSPATRGFAETLNTLNRDQIYKYFLCLELIKEGDSLTDVLKHYSGKRQNLIADVLELKELE